MTGFYKQGYLILYQLLWRRKLMVNRSLSKRFSQTRGFRKLKPWVDSNIRHFFSTSCADKGKSWGSWCVFCGQVHHDKIKYNHVYPSLHKNKSVLVWLQLVNALSQKTKGVHRTITLSILKCYFYNSRPLWKKNTTFLSYESALNKNETLRGNEQPLLLLVEMCSRPQMDWNLLVLWRHYS